MVTTSFYISPRGTVKNENFKTAKTEKVTVADDTKSEKNTTAVSSSEALYQSIAFDPEHELNYEVFSKALTGYENLKKAGLLTQDSHLLTICDFSMSSNTKRLWVIDLEDKKFCSTHWLPMVKIPAKNLRRIFLTGKVRYRAA